MGAMAGGAMLVANVTGINLKTYWFPLQWGAGALGGGLVLALLAALVPALRIAHGSAAAALRAG